MTFMTKTKTIYTLAIIAVAIISTIGVTGLDTAIPLASSQESYTIADGEQSTIKVTGDATMRVEPDQAVMIIVKQSQPTDLSSLLNDQKSSTDNLAKEIKAVIGDDPNSSVTIGQMSLNPAYWGNPSYTDISTFTVYSTTSVNTSIDNFSTIVKKLTESGYGFESVYADRAIMASVEQTAGGQVVTEEFAEPQPGEEPEDSNKITINVSVNTQPGKLDDVLEEYDSKYAKLVTILEAAGISSEDIRPSNVSVNPIYYGPSQTSIYQTYSQVIVKTDVKNIQKVSDAVQKSDAYVESTSLTVSDSAIENVRDEVNRQALENAKTRAETLASLAGLKIKGIKNIDAQSSIVNPYGGYQSYKGLYIIPPYYYQSTNGEIASSIAVEFELTK